MAKSANLYARIEPDVKEEAESILSTLGVPVSNAINMFYKQIILQRGLPFDVKLPRPMPVSVSEMTDAQLHQELEKGFEDMAQGRVKPAGQVFSALRREYNL